MKLNLPVLVAGVLRRLRRSSIMYSLTRYLSWLFLSVRRNMVRILLPLRYNQGWLETAFGLGALAGVLLSVVTHVYALRGEDILFPYASLLVDGVILFLIVWHGFLLREFKGIPDSEALKDMQPCWVTILECTVAAYVGVVFLVRLVRDHGMSAYISDGAYYLKGPGYPATLISEEVYRRYESEHMIGSSAYSIFFYLLPALYFLFRKRTKRASQYV